MSSTCRYRRLLKGKGKEKERKANLQVFRNGICKMFGKSVVKH